VVHVPHITEAQRAHHEIRHLSALR
jgi:hypothetical protein